MELSTMGGRRMTSQQLQQIQQLQQQQQQFNHQQQQQFNHRQQRLHNRHRKDTLNKNVSKYMYPPSSPSLQYNENIYHPHTKRNLYPEDPDIIEVYLEDDPVKLKDVVRHDAHGREIKWRNNIVATMERYEPAPGVMSATLPSSYLHHHQSTDSNLNPEYSYAYCEPVILKQQQHQQQHHQLQQQQQQQQQQHQQHQQQLHQNIPQIHKITTSVSSNALSKLPSTNSLRALLSKSFRKSSITSATSGGPERHTFTTRYGTKENIYEDVGAGSGMVAGAKTPNPRLTSTSIQSFESINKFNIHDELRHVQSQHDRIIGELNLSVETLIMPSKDEQDMMEEKLNEFNCNQYHDELSHEDNIAAGTSHAAMLQIQERLSPTTSQPNSGDVDSGISGSSSSGASYSSSMLYRTTTMYTNKSLTINDGADGGAMTMMAGSSMRSSGGSGVGGSSGGGFATCGGVSCSKMASNVVIPNSNKLTCCFYSDNLSKNSKTNSEHLDTGTDKSNFWNKLGKLKISGVFGGSSGSANNTLHQTQHQHHHHHHNHPTTTTNTTTMSKSNETQLDHAHDPEKWWQLPVCKSNRSQITQRQ